MKILIAAAALIIAAPAAAQTAPVHAEHGSEHQEHGSEPGGCCDHQNADGSPMECCKPGEDGKRPSCCDQQAAQKAGKGGHANH